MLSITWCRCRSRTNRSLDNLLGHSCGPDEGKVFEGWAEHGADRTVVPYTVATDTDSPNPDAGDVEQARQ